MRYVSLRSPQDLVPAGVTRHAFPELPFPNTAMLSWAQAGHPKKVLKKQSTPGKTGGGERSAQKQRVKSNQKYAYKDAKANIYKTGRSAGWDELQLGPWTLPDSGTETEEQAKERIERLQFEEREKVMDAMRRFAPEAACQAVTGQYRQGPISQLATVMWTPLPDDASYVARDAAAMAATYERAVDSMDPARTRFFFVFVQDVWSGSRQSDWTTWTLVSQLATDAPMAIDSRQLARQLSPRTITQLVKCTQWIRPDLVLRRRPQFRIRLEEQEPFFEGLLQKVSKTGAAQSPYYQQLYELLQVPPLASLEEVEVQYRRLVKNDQLALWAHIFLENPGNPLRELSLAYSTAQLDGGVMPAEEDPEDGIEFQLDGEGADRGIPGDDEAYDLEEAEQSMDFDGDVALNRVEEDWDGAEDEMSPISNSLGTPEEGSSVDIVALGPFDNLSLLRELHIFYVSNL